MVIEWYFKLYFPIDFPTHFFSPIQMQVLNLVGGIPTPLKNMSSSVEMMTFPTEWKNKSHVPNHQPVYIYEGFINHPAIGVALFMETLI